MIKKKGILSRNECLIIFGLMAIALLTRLYFMQYRSQIEYDGVAWSMLGKNLISGNGYIEPEGIYQFYYPPVYPIHIGFLWLLLKDVELAGRFVSVIYGTLVVLPIYFISRNIYTQKVALISIFLTIFFPLLIGTSTDVLADTTFTFYIVVAVFIGYTALKNKARGRQFLLLGFLLSIVYLTKSAGIQYVVLFVFWILLYAFLEKWNRTYTIKVISLFSVGFLFLSLPYLVYLRSHFGHWTSTGLLSENLYRGILEHQNDHPSKVYYLSKDSTFKPMFVSPQQGGVRLTFYNAIKDDPLAFIKGYLRSIKKEINYPFHGIKQLKYFLIILLVIGFIRVTSLRLHIKKEVFLASMCLPFFTYPMISSLNHRYIIPIIPFFIILLAQGINKLQIWFLHAAKRFPFFCKGKFYNKYICNYTIFIFILSSFFLTSFYYSITAPKQIFKFQPLDKEIGNWFKENLPPNPTIMSITPRLAFYAEGKSVIMPWAEFPEMIKYARHKKVDYIAIDERYVYKRRPAIAFLLDETKVPEELELIYKYKGKDTPEEFLIYRLKK